jgi:hypothetical protein
MAPPNANRRVAPARWARLGRTDSEERKTPGETVDRGPGGVAQIDVGAAVQLGHPQVDRVRLAPEGGVRLQHSQRVQHSLSPRRTVVAVEVEAPSAIGGPHPPVLTVAVGFHRDPRLASVVVPQVDAQPQGQVHELSGLRLAAPPGGLIAGLRLVAGADLGYRARPAGLEGRRPAPPCPARRS